METRAHESQKIILIYGLNGMQLLALSAMAEKEGIICRAVSDTQTSLTIQQLLSGKKYPPVPSAPLIGKFALLAGFDGQEHIAAAMINQVSGGVIKAAHTKHNSGWRFSELCTAILGEHEMMRKNRKS